MINDYCNQKIKLKRKKSTDKYNKATYYPEQEIEARFEYKRKLVRNRNGESVISEARMFTPFPVKLDDIIVYDDIDWTVISVSNNVDLFGNVIFYEVNL